MTVTKRKQKPRDTGGPDPVPTTTTVLESGMKASCDSCSADITHSVHVRCNELVKSSSIPGKPSDRLTCPDFDLCVPCFLAGKQVGPHRSHHAYRIISSHAFPIFHSEWGADEELLLIEGAEMYGLGNWADMAEHVGGRTKEECREHYMDTYIWSKNYPLPTVAEDLVQDQERFQRRKKARLEELQSRPVPQPPPKPMASAPTCHEVGGFMPGRLEFETEYENEAEVLIKDLEFGKVYEFGGQDQPATLEDAEREAEQLKNDAITPSVNAVEEQVQASNGIAVVDQEAKEVEKGADTEVADEPLKEKTESEEGEEPTTTTTAMTTVTTSAEQQKDTAEQEATDPVIEETPAPVPPMGQAPGDELQEDLELKLTLLDMFNERYDKRMAAKELIADRGLINYKQIVVNERKRNKEERDLILRAKPFAKIQTAMDHETFVDGLLYELTLRKRIVELQEYRRMGVTSLGDGERYEHAKAQRTSRSTYRDPLSALSRARSGGFGSQRTIFKPANSGALSRPSTSTPPALTLASASSLHLLTVLEQQLCSTLRILPKPYLFMKEILMREWARRGGKMTSRDARNLIVKKDASKKKKPDSTQMNGADSVGDVVMANAGEAQAEEGHAAEEEEDEWGEKVERCFEFLVDTGRLNVKRSHSEEEESQHQSTNMQSGLRPTQPTLVNVMSNGVASSSSLSPGA